MAGMDPKILAAVFASIAAIAIGTGGGTLEDISYANPSNMIGKFMESPSSLLSKLSKNPEAENSVEAHIEIQSPSSTIKVKNANLNILNFSTMASEDRSISSDSEISFPKFSGKVKLEKNNLTELSGSSQGFLSSGVNFTENFDLGFKTDSSKIVVGNIKRTSLNWNNVNVDLRSNSGTSIQKSNTSVKIDSFTGNMRIYPENMSISLSGKVNTFKADGAVFKGN